MLRRFMLWSGGAVAAMLVSLLGTTAYGGSGSELTFMFMTSGSLGAIFIGLGILLGTVVPHRRIADQCRQATGRHDARRRIVAGWWDGVALFHPDRRPDRPNLLLIQGDQYV